MGGVMEQQCLRELHMHGLLSAVDASYDYLGGAAEDERRKYRYKSKADLPKHSAGGKKSGGKKSG